MASLRNLIFLAIFGFILVRFERPIINFQVNSASAAAVTPGPADQLINALKNLITAIIDIIKKLLDQLLAALNSLLQDVILHILKSIFRNSIMLKTSSTTSSRA